MKTAEELLKETLGQLQWIVVMQRVEIESLKSQLEKDQKDKAKTK